MNSKAFHSCTRMVRHHASMPAWLSPNEQARAATFRDPSTRNAWLTARHAAKRLVAARLPGWPSEPHAVEMAAIDIQSRDASGRGVRPQVHVHGRQAPMSVSISHTASRVFVAAGVATEAVGVDLTPLNAFAKPASRWWLTDAERHDAAQLPAVEAVEHASACWSVKEAVYKALLADRPFDPRAIEVRLVRGLPVRCTAFGRAVPAAAIRTWRLKDHSFAMVREANWFLASRSGMVSDPATVVNLDERGDGT